MPLNFPASRTETIDRVKTDVQAELPQADPFLLNSWLQALMVGYGGRIDEVYLQLMLLLNELFIDTASDDFLERWGSYININKNPATISQGFCVAQGVIGSSIPAFTAAQSQAGNEYETQISANISANTNTITSLTFNSGTVTAVTSGNHNYASGISVAVSGATQPEYNGTFSIFVVNQNTFTYEISGSPITPATGSPQVTANTALLFLKSVDFGALQNVNPGESLSLTTPLAGVNSTIFANFEGLVGGTDFESNDDYRLRVLDGYQNPNTPFNVAEIQDFARAVSGVTRVFVEEPDTTTGDYTVLSLTQTGNVATATFSTPHGLISGMYISVNGADQLDYNVQSVPVLALNATTLIFIVMNNPVSPATGTIIANFAAVQPGQTKVIFTRDNDPNIIPSGIEVALVKAQLLKIKPAHMAAQDLIVAAPIAVVVNFQFSEIIPNTPTMQAAIIANLDAFFRDSTTVGQTLLQKAYIYAIMFTVDEETGEILEDFGLNFPSGDVTILSGELPVLGSVVFL